MVFDMLSGLGLGRPADKAPPAASAESQAAEKAKDLAKKAFDQASQAINKRSGILLLVVDGARIICDSTSPPKKINVLLVPDPRPRVEGKSQANIGDVVPGKNIKPWPCDCKKRPGKPYLPCDYRPAGLWTPGVPNEPVDSRLTNAGKGLKVAQDLMRDGFSANQAAGIVGNIMVESMNFTQHFQQGGGGGRGWIQWDGGRAKSFAQWSAKQGMDWTSDAANYGYLMAEMNGIDGSHWTTWKTDPLSGQPYTLDGFKNTQSVEQATDYFMNGYERPGVPHRDWRQERAKEIQRLLQTLALPVTATLKCSYGGIISIVDPNQVSKSAKL